MADLLFRRRLLYIGLAIPNLVFLPLFHFHLPIVFSLSMIVVLQRHTDFINKTAVGVGKGTAVVIFIISVTILNLFLYRQRRMSNTKGTNIL